MLLYARDNPEIPSYYPVKKEYRFAGVSVGYAREYHSLRHWEYRALRCIKLCSFQLLAGWRDNKTAKIFSCQ